ncbi:GntR family transcriptional regulator [Weissella ceti]|uniref:GntR family transcriptional regulator n=1 Tax=Weissella ceti TaxID=759620 RepID=A0ABT3E373_9LACO|nr:TrkA C-terminal domain-containing protein [Weissella ceti]MCW0952856.1 GntR family transcriptional regulator [Weissella ceti]QVK12553.1 GntR family transcriptional regulator [Weissella ceti]
MALVKQTPRYRQIAINIAHDIVDKNLNIGDKVQARSTVAIKYNVSPETARRAINVLMDVGIVETRQGSGTVITSYEKAVDFISAEDDKNTLTDLKTDLMNQITEQQATLRSMQDSLTKFFNQSQSFQHKNPLTPFELDLIEPSDAYGKSLSELNFWYMTGTTLVGILRHEQLTISPGPYATLEPGDKIYFIGDINAAAKVEAFLFNLND